jgi:hypothetical protein
MKYPTAMAIKRGICGYVRQISINPWIIFSAFAVEWYPVIEGEDSVHVFIPWFVHSMYAEV